VITLLANEFAKRANLEVHVIVYGRESPTNYVLSEKVTVHRPAFRFDNRMRLISTIRRLNYLRRIIKQGRYDALLSFGDRWNNFVMLACLGLHARVFLSDRSSPVLDIGWFQTLLRRLLYPRAAGLLAQTSQARDMAREHKLNDRICIVPNPVVRQQLVNESGRENIVLSVGRMVATKNYDCLIRIFASLNANNWRLIIVGDDAQGQKHRSVLEDLAGRLHVFDRVEFAGQQFDVQPFYDRAKIFAFTSSSEGFPNVVAEALASGLPVVSYDCVAGPSDLIRSGENGYLVKVFDEQEFGKKLAQLMVYADKRIEMSIAARESVAHLSVERVASRILGFVEGREQI